MTTHIELLKRFRDIRVLIAGEVGIDEYIWGDCHRLSPEAPVPVVEVESQTCRLGLAANVAQNISSLGGTAELVTVCGMDADAERISKMLADSAVGASIIPDESRPTLRKVRIIAQKQHIVRVDHERSHPLSPAIAKEFQEKIMAKLDQFDGLIVQDYGKGLWNSDTVTVISAARRLGKPVYVDPNRASPLHNYVGATLLTPNMNEAQTLCGVPRTSPKILGPNDSRLKSLARRIMDVSGADYSLITCGEWGMVSLDKSTGEFRRMPTFAREVSDVTGAGDTVIAVMAMMHAIGADIETCMKVSNAAAGAVVGKIGTASVTPTELSEELSRLRDLGY